MKFIAVAAIAAPVDHVWSHLSDAEGFERRIASRVGPVERTPPGVVAPGTRWSGAAEILGKARHVTVRLVSMTVPERLVLEGEADGLALVMEASLEAMGPARSRLSVTTSVAAKSLSAKLLLQPMKLAQASLDQRHRGAVEAFAAHVGAACADVASSEA